MLLRKIVLISFVAVLSNSVLAMNTAGSVNRTYGAIISKDSDLAAWPDQAIEKVEVLKFVDNQVSQAVLSQLYRCVAVKEIFLKNINLKILSPQLSGGLANVEAIYLSNNCLREIPGDAFRNLRKLKFLSLDQNEIKSLPDNVFEGNSNLAELNLSHNKLTRLSPVVLRGLSALTALDLGNNRLSSINIADFPNLERLFLHANELDNEPSIKNCPKLRCLILAGNKLSEMQVANMVSAAKKRPNFRLYISDQRPDSSFTKLPRYLLKISGHSSINGDEEPTETTRLLPK